MDKLSNAIVEQSLKDLSFCKDAGRMCYTLVEVSLSYVAHKL